MGNFKFSSKRTLVESHLSSSSTPFSSTTNLTTKTYKKMKLSITTWNIAAINNNPFEYWLTIANNPEYELLMKNIEEFIENPTDTTDILVKDIFTNEMFERLDKRLTTDAGWDSVQSYWVNDFQNRKIISQFMKDKVLGNKRLASMPDRITNTINLASTNGKSIACRPTVINMYDGDLSSMDMWYYAWESFMFDHKLSINVKGTVKDQIPYEMLQPIKKAKYPDITEEEEKVSLPLQTLCGAIFDGILVHMMNTVSKPDVWQPLKKTIVDSLTTKKVPKTLEILEDRYMPISDIITLQEVSSAFIDKAKTSKLGTKYHIIAPNDIDSTRDQNSIIMLCKTIFPSGKIDEITSSVSSNFPKDGKKVPVANGDILVITTKDKDDVPYIIASFHGDTNGLATIPVLDAIMKTKEASHKDHKLIFCLDANTYEKAKPGKMQDVLEFGKSYTSHHLTSCFGNVPNPTNYTTYNTRTYLQPQLNKACKSSDKRKLGDVNPKDFILFDEDSFNVVKTWKDNTGNVDMEYVEDMAFPTLDFPSDHGILSTTVESK